jgi:hypothetical protein
MAGCFCFANLSGFLFGPSQKGTICSSVKLIHFDICDPFPVKSLTRSFYFMTFVDDFSCKIWVYFLRWKNEVFSKFKLFKVLSKVQCNRKVDIFIHISWRKYVNDQVVSFCDEVGIK